MARASKQASNIYLKSCQEQVEVKKDIKLMHDLVHNKLASEQASSIRDKIYSAKNVDWPRFNVFFNFDIKLFFLQKSLIKIWRLGRMLKKLSSPEMAF